MMDAVWPISGSFALASNKRFTCQGLCWFSYKPHEEQMRGVR